MILNALLEVDQHQAIYTIQEYRIYAQAQRGLLSITRLASYKEERLNQKHRGDSVAMIVKPSQPNKHTEHELVMPGSTTHTKQAFLFSAACHCVVLCDAAFLPCLPTTTGGRRKELKGFTITHAVQAQRTASSFLYCAVVTMIPGCDDDYNRVLLL